MRQMREIGRLLRPFEATYQYATLPLPWWHLAPFGYLMSFVLVALVVMLLRCFPLKEVHRARK